MVVFGERSRQNSGGMSPCAASGQLVEHRLLFSRAAAQGDHPEEVHMTAELARTSFGPATATLEFDYAGDRALGRRGLRPPQPRVSVIVPASAVWDDFFDAPGIELGAREQPPAQSCSCR